MTHEFEGTAYAGDGDTIGEMITGAEWDGWPLMVMNRETLYQHGKDGGIVNYVWPHEGQFVQRNGRTVWKFHGGKVMDGKTEIDCPSKPLLIDASSARGFMLVWDVINEKNRTKTEGFLLSRGLTCWMFDKLIWPNVSFGGRS